jgi:hypothetical protein
MSEGVCTQVFELPTVLAYPLFYKLVAPGLTTVSHDSIQTWLQTKNVVRVRSLAHLSVFATSYLLVMQEQPIHVSTPAITGLAKESLPLAVHS